MAGDMRHYPDHKRNLTMREIESLRRALLRSVKTCGETPKPDAEQHTNSTTTPTE